MVPFIQILKLVWQAGTLPNGPSPSLIDPCSLCVSGHTHPALEFHQAQLFSNFVHDLALITRFASDFSCQHSEKQLKGDLFWLMV